MIKDLIGKTTACSHAMTKLDHNGQQQPMQIQDICVTAKLPAMLDAIIDSSDEAIISMNVKGMVYSWNYSAERVFGYRSAEMLGGSIIELINNHLLDGESVVLQCLARTENVEGFLTKCINRQGDVLDVSLSLSAIQLDAEQIGFIMIVRDISFTRQAEQSNTTLSQILALSKEAIMNMDLNGDVYSWNPAAENIFGYSALEMIGKPFSILIPKDRRQEEVMILNSMMEGLRLDLFETKRLNKAGLLIAVTITTSPILDAKGNIMGSISVFQDITDKKLEQKRKNDFIEIASHELKTPLTSIKSYIQLAISKAKAREDHFSFNVLNRADIQTQYMTNMIHDFLNVSRFDEGKMSLNFSLFSLKDLMEELVSEAILIAPEHLIDYSGCPAVELLADRNKITQVLVNLLQNAIKYSSNGTTIKIACELSAEQVLFAISDQGIGISQANQLRLFERFYSGNQSMINAGFGIGLYLVAKILKMHGSSIQVLSEIGSGSVFSFALPIHKDSLA